MSDIAAFKQALKDAGQPWSGRGVRVVGCGIVMLALLQIVVFIGVDIPYALYVMFAAIAVIAVGWAMLIVAALQRARWARAHPVEDFPITLADAP